MSIQGKVGGGRGRTIGILSVLLATLLVACGTDSETEGSAEGSDEGGAESQQAVEWNYHSANAPDWRGSEIQAAWADAVRDTSEGQLDVEIFWSGGLGLGDSSAFRAVSDGTADAGHIFAGATAGEVPLVSGMELPFLVPSDIEVRQEVADEIRPILGEAFEERGVKLLAIAQLPPRNLYSTSPLSGLEDARGQSIRTVGPFETALTDSLGISATSIDGDELFTAVEQGVVDGYWFTSEATIEWGLADLVEHMLRVEQGGAAHFMIANLERFEALPQDVQDAVEEHAREAENELWEMVPDLVEMDEDLRDEYGVEISELSEEDREAMETAAEPVWDEWLEQTGERGQEMMDAIRSVLDDE